MKVGERRAEGPALLGILALAAALRLGWPGLTEFKADEARLFTLALDMAELKAWSWCGIGSSVGLPNSPVSVYLTALPLALPFMRNPIGGVLWVGALSTASVLLCYVIGRRFWGVRTGLIAALLFAAAPWAVIYSRKIWAQNYLPLFTLAAVGAALLAVVEGRRRWIAAHLVLLAVLVQIHLSALALIPATVTILLLYRREVAWRWVAIGAGLAAVAFIPYAGCALTQAGPTGGETVAGLAAQPAQFSLDSAALAWLVAIGKDIHSLAGPQAFRQFLASAPRVEPLWWVEGVLIVGGVIYWIVEAIRRRGQPDARAGAICALWFVLPPFFFLWRSTPVFPHYFITMLPAPYLAAGALLAAATRRWARPWLTGLAFAVTVLIAAAQAGLFVALLQFLATHNTPGGFGTPVRLQIEVARGLQAQMAETGATEVLLVSDGEDPAFHETPAVFDVLLRAGGVPHRFVDGRTSAILPDHAALALLAPGELAAQDMYFAWAAVTPPIERYVLRPGEGEYLAVTLTGAAAVPPHPAGPLAVLANGAQILGYDWRGELAPSRQIAWELWWQVGEAGAAPDAPDYHIFNHLVDASETRWGQQDGAAPRTENWRPGDLVVSFFELPVAAEAAPGRYWVRVGMYTLPDIANVPVLDAAGLPAADAVRLGPLGGP